MMKKFSNFLFAMLCFYSIDLKAQDQQKIKQIINSTVNKLAENKYINYTVDNLSLTVGNIDTAFLEVKVNRNKEATYFFAKRIKCVDNYVILKDSISYQYVVNECNKTFNKDTENTEKPVFWGMFQSGNDRFDSSYISKFLNTNFVKYEYINNELVGKEMCYKIKILQPDMGNIFTEGYTIFYISKDDYMLLKIEEAFKLNGENSYYSFEIKEYSFKETDMKNKINEIEQSYTFLSGESFELSDSLKQIKYAKSITEITGKKIGDIDSSSISFKDKVVLIDFWYMACYGCMLSYPVVDSINNIYKANTNFILLSFNLRDTDPRLLKRVQNYISKNHITLNTYFAPREISYNLFGENGFPLFVVIDDTRIKCVQLGYNDELFKTLKKNIDESLMKYKK